MSHVWEHYNDPSVPARALHELLGQRGLVYIEVPGLLDLRNRLEYACDFGRYFTCSHPYHYDLMTLTSVLNREGFRLVWGNEVVESFFGPGEQRIEIGGNARRVMTYLEDLETMRGLSEVAE